MWEVAKQSLLPALRLGQSTGQLGLSGEYTPGERRRAGNEEGHWTPACLLRPSQFSTLIHLTGVRGTRTLCQAPCHGLGKGAAPGAGTLEELTVGETYLQIKVICVETEGRKPLSPGAVQQTLQKSIMEEVMMYDEPEPEL